MQMTKFINLSSPSLTRLLWHLTIPSSLYLLAGFSTLDWNCSYLCIFPHYFMTEKEAIWSIKSIPAHRAITLLPTQFPCNLFYSNWTQRITYCSFSSCHYNLWSTQVSILFFINIISNIIHFSIVSDNNQLYLVTSSLPLRMLQISHTACPSYHKVTSLIVLTTLSWNACILLLLVRMS